MSITVREQLREKFQTPEDAKPNLLSVATALVQKLSRIPERLGTADLPYDGREYALPLFMSLRDVVYGGWGRIYAHVQNPAQFTLVFEIDHDGRTFEFILNRNAIRGDSVSFAGYGSAKFHLEHMLYQSPQAWLNEITELFLAHYAEYMLSNTQ